MSKAEIGLSVNGRQVQISAAPGLSLLEFLRGELELTGAKQGCGVGECGACTVLVDGVPVNSCIYLAVWADGKAVTTVEGLEAPDGGLSAVQRSFVEQGAVQCGFCTPGLVMSTTAMAATGETYSDEEIRRGLSGHLCRCTGYDKIFGAAKACVGNGSCHKQTAQASDE